MINIEPQYLEIVRQILLKHVPKAHVWVFGSRITGKFKKYSDLDLAIINAKPLTLSEITELKEAFVESDLPFRVDIVDWNAISEEFRAVIARSYEELSL